jgi:hypothetical protein
MTSTMVERIMAAYATRGGALKPNPIVEASEVWGPNGSVDKLRAWMMDETTRRVVGLLQELAVNPPSGIVSVDKVENYGLTTGLQLAARVVEDPTMLFPDVFRDEAPGQTALPEADYSTGV